MSASVSDPLPDGPTGDVTGGGTGEVVGPAAQPWSQPAPWIAFLRRHIWVIGILFFLAMLTIMRPFLIRRPPPPEIVGEVPAFTLVDERGESFTREDLLAADKVWIVGFVFTRCPSICPTITRAMQSFQEQIDNSKLGDRVALLTVTVDPENDTPAVLADYAESYGIGGNWRLLTGEQAAIEDFVVGGFKLAVGEREEVEPGVYDIAHSSKLALVDRFGNIRGYYSIDDEGLAELYHRTLRTIRVKEDES